jgi:hypothetical protein
MAKVLSIHDPAMLELVTVLLQQGKKVQIRVSGSSMRPFLQGGETVELAPVSTVSLSRGDLLLHLNPTNSPLLHRLIRQRKQNGQIYLQSRGDNCAAFDAFVPAESIIARVETVFIADAGKGGQKVIKLRRPMRRIQAYCIAGTILIKYYIRRCSDFYCHYGR